MVIFFWQVDIMIWQVNINKWQVNIKIWQVDIIIWQVMAEICHHTCIYRSYIITFIDLFVHRLPVNCPSNWTKIYHNHVYVELLKKCDELRNLLEMRTLSYAEIFHFWLPCEWPWPLSELTCNNLNNLHNTLCKASFLKRLIDWLF